jgi:hypothetical protein
MPEETNIVETPIQEQGNGVVTIQATPFGGNAWSETPPEPKKEEPKIEPPIVTPEAEVPKKDEEEIIEEDEVYKREFGKTKQEFKSEYEELKKFRETKPEYKFENEESKRLAEAIAKGDRKEVRKILETQERLEEFTAKEVNDETAEDIIKLGMQLKYKDLSPKEIEYKFNKDFGLPKQPVQREEELDDDFASRKNEWQEKVNDIKMARSIEAKLAKPELEKLKSQIVLPVIDNAPAKANEPTQEELDNQKKWVENFMQSIESNYTKAEGFSTKVKDESVELPVSFKIPEEDKVAIKESFKKGFDITDYMAKRWFDESNNPKTEQMIYDRFVLDNLDKILSGIANNAANDRLDAFKKTIKNIDLGKTTNQETFNPEQNGKKVSPFSKDAWSEQPIRQN